MEASASFQAHYNKLQTEFEGYLGDFWKKHRVQDTSFLSYLDESMSYSLLQKGAKRFRPVVSLMTADMVAGKYQEVLAFAAAVEMVHCFSLIHDDLPCMDDDDTRRGEPTNHIQFDEATALLAGDALLIEAFTTLAREYALFPQMALGLVDLLSTASGKRGMVGGQIIDIRSQLEKIDVDGLKQMHALKTGALIGVSVNGAALISQASEEQSLCLKNYGELLGLAFQLADDLLDAAEEVKDEEVSFVSCLGEDKTKSFLAEVTDRAMSELKIFGTGAQHLRDLCLYNQSRTF